MKKIKKIFLGSLFFAMPLLSLSCSTGSLVKNEFQDSKDIYVAKVESQKGFWDQVVSEFNKTSFATEHKFNIKFIEKNEFGVIDNVTTLGFQDKNSPDLIYAPQDRITSLLQTKSIRKWDESIKDEILSQVGASDAEKSFINSFGSFQRSNEDTPSFYNFAHNKEGIVLMTKKSLPEVKADFANTSTDEMVELVKAGKAFFRIQDGWYGNGILGGVLSPEQMRKIIYKNGQNWSSGFLKDDPNHEKFKEALSIAAELMYPIWEAAFKLSQEEYTKTVWAKKDITQGDLQTLLQADLGPVQNKVLELVSSAKLDYAMVGSWDIGTSSKQGINTYVNFPKLKNDYEYKQAPGSWSWSINARNNGVSENRINAIYELLKIIFKTDSYYGYFKGDTKIPYFVNVQNGLKSKIDQDNVQQNQALTNFAKEAGFENLNDFNNEYNQRFDQVNKILEQAFPKNNSWEQTQNPSPLDESNTYQDKLDNIGDEDKAKFIGITDELFNELKSLEFKKAIALRNAIAAIIGLNTLAELKGKGGESWQASRDLVKADFEKEMQHDNDNAHLRKIEKYIFGVNGDEQSDKDDLVKQLSQKDSFTSAVESIHAKALEFSRKYAKNNVDENNIKKAVELYLANYWNQAIWNKFKNKYLEIWKTSKFKKKDGQSDSSMTIEQVINEVNKYRSSNVADKIISVITSTNTIANNGFGILKLQNSRLDNSNPQFGGAFWSIWNEGIWGNTTIYRTLSSTVKNEQEFKDYFINKFDELYRDRVNVLKSSNSEDFILD
ncbi:hypothetical protein [Mycoplasmopsis pulmonis]|uniref:hypothetical protein n=1 Tax=Mycoplasmopsis pulmonis TaxID=2107 RepID=UPI002ACE6B34|nr:hypothetical protein [Mycoplasmopsis pulmonis]MDZ7293561.1 hypothetical protein [Mycoplasmopsis pulmonis]